MKVGVYNQEGKEVGTTLLPKEIFEVKLIPDLVYQTVFSQKANRKRVTAQVKDRGDVRGGGKKPWRQKGTGRARHGSRRSPLWKGGGVTFGPTNQKVFKKKINKQARKKALFMVLSEKAKNNSLIVLDDLNLTTAKTKNMAQFLSKLPLKGQTCLLVLPKREKNILTAAANLPKIAVREARNLNALDLLSFKHLIMPKEAIKTLKENFLK